MKKLILDSLQKIDFIIWLIVLIFFLGSALVLGGDINNSFLGASGIIVLMFLIGFSIELILSSIQNVKGIGKITGFITNGPEALVLIVGLIQGNVLFASSVPLGSNVMNPILLLIAIGITGYLIKIKKFNHKIFFTISFVITAILAIVFFKFPESYYLYWLIPTLIISIYLFTKQYNLVEVNIEKVEKGVENVLEEDEKNRKINKLYLPFGLIILIVSGYFLDPIVNFTAESSMAPKGIIGFLVLSTLTSWSEFKSVLALLKRKKVLDAFDNILVSNITNLWLAIIGVSIWMIIK